MLTPKQTQALKVGDRVALEPYSGQQWQYATVVRVGAKSVFLDNGLSIAFSTGYGRSKKCGCTTNLWRMPSHSFAEPMTDEWKLHASFAIAPKFNFWHIGTDVMTVDQIQAIAKILGVTLAPLPEAPNANP
jgi:hypothetical protein